MTVIYYQNLKNEEGKPETPFIKGPNGKAHFTIYCGVCGTGLCAGMVIKREEHFNRVYVQPCEKCKGKNNE